MVGSQEAGVLASCVLTLLSNSDFDAPLERLALNSNSNRTHCRPETVTDLAEFRIPSRIPVLQKAHQGKALRTRALYNV
jgi:predicted Ser/Thr protein kinase